MSIILTALQGALSCQYGPSPIREPLTVEAALQAIINHEANTVWDKQFDRYSSYWVGRFSSGLPSLSGTDLVEQVRQVNNLRIHQASAWAQPNQYRKGKKRLAMDTSNVDTTKLSAPLILQH